VLRQVPSTQSKAYNGELDRPGRRDKIWVAGEDAFDLLPSVADMTAILLLAELLQGTYQRLPREENAELPGISAGQWARHDSSIVVQQLQGHGKDFILL